MNSQTIVYCVVALLLGMLLAHMLKDVCGCDKVVEGSVELRPNGELEQRGPNPYGPKAANKCKSLECNGNCICTDRPSPSLDCCFDRDTSEEVINEFKKDCEKFCCEDTDCKASSGHLYYFNIDDALMGGTGKDCVNYPNSCTDGEQPPPKSFMPLLPNEWRAVLGEYVQDVGCTPKPIQMLDADKKPVPGHYIRHLGCINYGNDAVSCLKNKLCNFRVEHENGNQDYSIVESTADQENKILSGPCPQSPGCCGENASCDDLFKGYNLRNNDPKQTAPPSYCTWENYVNTCGKRNKTIVDCINCFKENFGDCTDVDPIQMCSNI